MSGSRRDERFEPRELIHRPLAEGMLVDLRDADPRTRAGQLGFAAAEVLAGRAVVVERLGDQLERHPAVGRVGRPREPVEMARDERDERPGGILAGVKPLGVEGPVDELRPRGREKAAATNRFYLDLYPNDGGLTTEARSFAERIAAETRLSEEPGKPVLRRSWRSVLLWGNVALIGALAGWVLIRNRRLSRRGGSRS